MTRRKNTSDAGPSAEPEVKANVNGKRRHLALLIGAGFLILMLAFGLPFVLHEISHESTDDAYTEGAAAVLGNSGMSPAALPQASLALASTMIARPPCWRTTMHRGYSDCSF